MIDLQTGNIMIYPDLILHSNLTFLEFMICQIKLE